MHRAFVVWLKKRGYEKEAKRFEEVRSKSEFRRLTFQIPKMYDLWREFYCEQYNVPKD